MKTILFVFLVALFLNSCISSKSTEKQRFFVQKVIFSVYEENSNSIIVNDTVSWSAIIPTHDFNIMKSFIDTLSQNLNAKNEPNPFCPPSYFEFELKNGEPIFFHVTKNDSLFSSTTKNLEPGKYKLEIMDLSEKPEVLTIYINSKSETLKRKVFLVF